MLQYLKDVKTFITVGVSYQGKNNILSAVLLCMKILKKLSFLQTIIDNSRQNHSVIFFPKSKQFSFFCFVILCSIIMFCPSHLGSLQSSDFTFPYIRTKKPTVEINKVIQFGKDLWKLSHPTSLTQRTASKLDQAVQGLV